MKCSHCGYDNGSEALVCGLCGVVFRKTSGMPRPVPAPAGAAAALALPARGAGASTLVLRRNDDTLRGAGWGLVGLGLLAAGLGALLLMFSDVVELGSAPLQQFVGGGVLIGLGVGALAGSRLCFKIGFWLYAADTALFVVAILAGGAFLMAGGLVVRLGIFVWLLNQYRAL